MTAKSFMRRLGRDRRGAALIEFAFASPVLIAALIGIVQIGQLLYAGAEVRGVVGDAARLVKTNSDMSEDALQAYINSRVHSTGTIKIGTPTLQSGTTESGAKYRTIDLSYTVQLDFVFFSTDPITIDASRRVYVF